MQRNSVAMLAGLSLLCASICGAELNMDWAYHNAAGSDRTQEFVPGQSVGGTARRRSGSWGAG